MTNRNDGSRVARDARSRERAAMASAVPGFPEIVARETQCRLCSMVDTDPDLLRRVHTLFTEGKGVRALETEIGRILEARNERPMNVQCFARHLKNHVDFALVTLLEGPSLDDSDSDGADEDEDEVGVEADAEASIEISDEDEGDDRTYFDMRKLAAKWRKRMFELDQSTETRVEGKINTYGLTILLQVGNAYRATLESLNRIKNNNALMKAILKSHAKRQAQVTSTPIIGNFEKFRARLEAVAPALVDEFDRDVVDKTRMDLLLGAKAAVEESVETYRLH